MVVGEYIMIDKKVFRTHNQQLKILRRRGLEVPKNGTPKRILEKVNYYNLINGYKDLFIDSPGTDTTEERYKQGAKFLEIYALYTFDYELKMILLSRILQIEKTLKSEIAYVFSKKYGYDNYLKISNFEIYPNSHKDYNKRLKDVTSLISNIQHDIAKHVRNNSIKHYLTNHGYIPLWVLVNILTFGRISYFYEYMKPAERNEVARIYNIRDGELLSLIKILTLCRNKCAHDERLYNFYSRESIKDNKIHSSLGIPKNKSGTYKKGKHDLFAVLIAIKILLNKKSFKKMILEIKKSLEALDKQLSVISIDEILDKMGFPSNWIDIIND